MNQNVLEKVKPALSVVGTVLNTANLIENGVKPQFQELLLPSIITTFASPLVANSIYPRYKITIESIVIYLIGFLISLKLYKQEYVIRIFKYLPLISKTLSLIDLKNNDEKTIDLFSWLLISEIAGIIIKRLVLKKKMKLKESEIIGIAVNYTGLFFIRELKLPDFTVIILVLLMPVGTKVSEYLKKMRLKKSKELETPPSTQVRRTPRRKASISYMLEQQSMNSAKK